MRRRNNRTKAAETLTKKDPQFGFTLPDPSSSRENSDLKRRRRGTFDDVDQRSSSKESLEAQTERSVDAKTSEFAFFKKLKSDFGLRSESSNSKSSDRVEQNLETFESRVKPGGKIHKGLGLVMDFHLYRLKPEYSFSTPIHSARGGSFGLTPRDIEKDPGKSSSGFSRDKDMVRSGNNLRSGGSSDEKGDIFSVKRKKLHEWVKDAWFPENPELTSKGRDLVSVLLTRLFPGTEERHPCRFSKERTDRVKRRTFVDDSPGSKFLKRSYESYTEVDHSLQMKKDRSISWQGWLENSIEPSLQFATDQVHSGFIPRDPEEIGFSISHRPPLLKQRASPVEETLECSPISSLQFRNYKPLSLGYHRDESVYGSEELSHERRALLVEWNTESRKTDDLPLITYPNTSSSSLTDNPWSSGYSSSHDLVSRELYPLPLPLPLVSHYTSDSHFEHELERERHTIDDKDAVAINLNLQTFHHTNSSASDFLTRDYTYDDNLSNSPVDYCPSEVPGCEIVSFPFTSISSSNLFGSVKSYTKRSF